MNNFLFVVRHHHRHRRPDGHADVVHAIQGGLIDEGSILELGQVIKDPAMARTSEDQITVADLTGVAIQDIQIAKMVDRTLR